MKKLSTTALSKKLNMENHDLFDELVRQDMIYRKDDQWLLTKKGKEFGGETVFKKQYGEFIIWPPELDPFNLQERNRQQLLSATRIGQEFDLSSQRINLVFAEIGWIEKAIKGWTLTKLGRNIGGRQFEHKSGGTYVLWPSNILTNSTFKRSISFKSTNSSINKQSISQHDNSGNFRKKFPANLRTKDGHQVRSRAEVIIDNALYDYGLAHAYERKLPIEENVYSDFYIPSKNGGKAVYIEFWGMENDNNYAKRKKTKKDLYSKHDFNLIELTDKHIENLDDFLPRMLLKFGIRVE